MKLKIADIADAELIGTIHSVAWRQAYIGIFPEIYILEDTPIKRTQEFLASLNDKSICYYLICEDEKAIGVIKIKNYSSFSCEILSFYILDEYRNRGYGKQIIIFLEQKLCKKQIQLWVLESNNKAIKFYECTGFIKTQNVRKINRGKSFTQLQYKKNCRD